MWPGRIDPHHRLPQRAGRAGDLVRGFPLYAQAHEEGCHLGRRRLAAHDDAEHLRREALAQRPAIGEEGKRFLKRRGSVGHRGFGHAKGTREKRLLSNNDNGLRRLIGLSVFPIFRP